MIERIITLLIGLSYMFIGYAADGLRGLFFTAVYVFITLSFIWKSRQWGHFTGLVGLHMINFESSGGTVKFMGWLFLIVLPMVTVLLIYDLGFGHLIEQLQQITLQQLREVQNAIQLKEVL